MILIDALGAALRGSVTAYVLVNAAHILGIALLIGAILPLDLRLAGAFRGVPLAAVVPFLRGVAALGLALAAVTGVMLVSVNLPGYLGNGAFRVKVALLCFALANLIWLQASGAMRRAAEGEVTGALRFGAKASALLWLGVLLAGRWIGFV